MNIIFKSKYFFSVFFILSLTFVTKIMFGLWGNIYSSEEIKKESDEQTISYGFRCIDSVLFYLYRKDMDILDPVWVNGVSIKCDHYGNYLHNGIEAEKKLIEEMFMNDFLLEQEKESKKVNSGGIPVIDGENIGKLE